MAPRTILRLYAARCIALHPDGRVQGFRALIPYARIKPYQRAVALRQRGRAGKAGALTLLLERYPVLDPFLREQLKEHRLHVALTGKGNTARGLRAVHGRVRTLCKALGIAENEYLSVAT